MIVSLIYYLADPIIPKKGYVGHSSRPLRRYATHLRCCGRGRHKNRWIKKLQRAGLVPVFCQITWVPADAAANFEQMYIRQLKGLGYTLKNGTEGGEGLHGHKHSALTRAKMSESHIGKKQTPEHVEKRAAANRGKKQAPEHRAKMAAIHAGLEYRAQLSASLTGRSFSPEHRANIAAAKRGRKQSPEHIAKRSAQNTGKKRPMDAIAKTAAARRGQKHSTEAKAKMSAAAYAREERKRSNGQ